MSGTRQGFSPAPTRTLPLRAGAGIPRHQHDEHQLIYASRGVVSVTTDDGVWVAPPTRGLWIPARTAHEHRVQGATTLHTVGLPLDTDPLGLSSPAVLAVDPLLRELVIEYARDGPTSGPERRRLRAVLVDRLRVAPEQPLHVPRPHDPRLRAIEAALVADPIRGSVTEVGRPAGASPRTISRLCRDELGMSFPQWRTQLRLRHALELLALGLPVGSVAIRCGWTTPSAFIEVFHRTLGYTPGTRGTR